MKKRRDDSFWRWLATEIVVARARKRWSQPVLAREAKVHKSTIENLESGRGGVMRPTIVQVCDALGLDSHGVLQRLAESKGVK